VSIGRYANAIFDRERASAIVTGSLTLLELLVRNVTRASFSIQDVVDRSKSVANARSSYFFDSKRQPDARRVRDDYEPKTRCGCCQGTVRGHWTIGYCGSGTLLDALSEITEMPARLAEGELLFTGGSPETAERPRQRMALHVVIVGNCLRQWQFGQVTGEGLGDCTEAALASGTAAGLHALPGVDGAVDQTQRRRSRAFCRAAILRREG